MHLNKFTIKVFTAFLIGIIALIAPITPAFAENNAWNEYEKVAQMFGCSIKISEKDKMKFMKSMPIDAFIVELEKQKNDVRAINSEAVIECTVYDTNNDGASTLSSMSTTGGTATNVWTGSGMIGATIGLKTYITATYYTSTNTFKSCDKVSSTLYGVTLGYKWVPNEWVSSINSTQKVLNVTLYGTLEYYIVTDITGPIISWPKTLYYSCTLP